MIWVTCEVVQFRIWFGFHGCPGRRCCFPLLVLPFGLLIVVLVCFCDQGQSNWNIPLQDLKFASIMNQAGFILMSYEIEVV